ncbi:unnamed protein product [Effrenium voratum]|nr:unnamed protein product [Effrenium voratum]
MKAAIRAQYRSFGRFEASCYTSPQAGLASFDVKAASLRLPLQVWARDVLDRIHGFAVHVGLFCLIEEYARLGLFGGQPASSGQPVTDWQLPLQGLGGELLH